MIEAHLPFDALCNRLARRAALLLDGVPLEVHAQKRGRTDHLLALPQHALVLLRLAAIRAGEQQRKKQQRPHMSKL